jgi:hypothetical protein
MKRRAQARCQDLSSDGAQNFVIRICLNVSGPLEPKHGNGAIQFLFYGARTPTVAQRCLRAWTCIKFSFAKVTNL